MANTTGQKFGGRKKGTPNKQKTSNVVLNSLLFDLIGSIKSGNSYVYKHYYNGDVVYVGKGTNNRAWDRRRTIDKHTDIMGDIDVVIVCGNLSSDEALCIEASLIRFHNPIYNDKHTL